MTLGDLFQVTATATATGSRTAPLVRTYEADPPADLGGYPANLRGARVALDGLRSLVPGAGEVTDPIARTLWSSGARSLDADGRDAMVGSAERSITAITDEIVVAPEQVVTLTSSSGEVPLNLENRLPYEARVRIVLTSAKLDFPEGSVIEQTIPAAQTTTIKLPVETRASGAFPLTVDITSANGDLPVATTRYTVRSTAISGIGLILSIGAGLFLLVWWARHFRTSRRARKLVASNHPALSGTSRMATLRPTATRVRPRRTRVRPTPTLWRADEPSPHRHRQLLRPHPRRDRRPGHRRRAPEHPLRTDEYIDREQLSVEDFYATMASTGLLPETAAPSPGPLRAGVPRRPRGRRRLRGLHQPLRRPVGHRAVGPHRGQGARGRDRRPRHRQPLAHRWPRHHGPRRRRRRRRVAPTPTPWSSSSSP